MTAWLPTSSRLKFDDLIISRPPFADALPRLRKAAHNMREILSICSRAQIAAHHYEQLKPLSDTGPCGKGPDASDVPRAAFRKLTETLDRMRRTARTPIALSLPISATRGR